MQQSQRAKEAAAVHLTGQPPRAESIPEQGREESRAGHGRHATQKGSAAQEEDLVTWPMSQSILFLNQREVIAG